MSKRRIRKNKLIRTRPLKGSVFENWITGQSLTREQRRVMNHEIIVDEFVDDMLMEKKKFKESAEYE